MSGALSLKLLGGFDAELAGRPMPPLARKTQALLAYLAIEAATPRPRSELATLLWGDTGDEQALQSLRKALSGLRQALGDHADEILTLPEGAVGLNRAAIAVDVLEFEEMGRQSRAGVLQQACDQYKGQLLAGLDLDEGPFNEWLLSRRERYRELALNTLDRLLEIRISQNELDLAAAAAARLLELEPLHEPAHRSLIEIYGRQGRRAAAARQYQLCIEVLARELGVKPEPATEAAYRKSLEAKPATAADAAVKPDTPVAPESPAPSVARTRSFQIAAAIVAIVMIGAIAAYAFRSRAERGPSGPRRSVAILAMKNLSEQAEHAWLSTALTETIGSELMAGGEFRLVSPENMSRMQEALSPPLGVGLNRKQLDEIGRNLGCDLVLSGGYLAVGNNVRVDVRLDDVATGEPVANSSVSGQETELLALLDRAGDELREGLGVGRASSNERRSMRAAFPTTPESRRLYFLGVDAWHLRDGPKAADLLQQAIAAEPNLALAHVALTSTWKLLGYDGRAQESAKRALASSDRLSAEDRMFVEATLAEASWDWPKAIEGYGRLWKTYPDNIEYGLKVANAQWIGAKYDDAIVTVAEMRKLPGADGADPRIDLVEATLLDYKDDDYKKALAIATHAADTALDLKATLLLARARLKQGVYHHRLREYDKALERMAESRQLFESLGDRGGVADALRWEGTVLTPLKRLDLAEQKLAEAAAIIKPLGYVRLNTEILIQQSTVIRNTGRIAATEAPLDLAVASAREAGEPDALGRALFNAGIAKRNLGKWAEAQALYAESLPFYERLHTKLADASARNLRNNIAIIDFLQGRSDKARPVFEALLAEDRKAEYPVGEALRLANLALLAAERGDTAEAEKLTSQSCVVNEKIPNNKPNTAACRIRLARLWLQLGRRDEALKFANAVGTEEIAESTQAPWEFARLVSLYVETGLLAKAGSAINEGLKSFGKKENPPDQLIWFELARARYEAATGKRAAALERVRKARLEAQRLELGLLLKEIDSIFPKST